MEDSFRLRYDAFPAEVRERSDYADQFISRLPSGYAVLSGKAGLSD